MKVFFFNDTATTEICTLSLHDALPVFLFVLFVLSVVPSSGQEAEFFEARVRPVLVESCFRCHGPQKQMSGLRLDSRAALLQGGDNGPALKPGDPENSALIQAVRHEGQRNMPPKAKLARKSVV